MADRADPSNAVSVPYQVPVGGADLAGCAGAPRPIRASGDEPFDIVAGGEDVVERPERGGVVRRIGDLGPGVAVATRVPARPEGDD